MQFLTMLFLACPLALDAPAPRERQTRDLTFYLRRLRTVDHLPRLEESHTALASTWSRAGDVSDPDDFKRIEGTRNILLDTNGPGCVHRIFVGRLGEEVAGTRIQIFLDRAAQPVFDLPVEKFFDYRNGPVPYPLVFHKTYPGMLLPIPFRTHCLIQLVNPERTHWGSFWQIAYTTYDPSTEVESLNWPLKPGEREEVAAVCREWIAAEDQAPPEPKWTSEHTLDLPASGMREIRLQGAGIIRELGIGSEPATPEALRKLRMRMTWDKSGNPSVDVPVGYYFGHADHEPLRAAQYSSLLLGVSDGQGRSRFPMPFEDGAIIAFHNQSATDPVRVQLRLAVDSLPALPEDFGRFHVTWAEKRAVEPDAPRYGQKRFPAHIVLQREDGPGKYVGTLLHVVWPYTKEWWGEGDWLIWTDENDWPPSYHGTGTEEYFNSGWGGFDRKAISGYVTTRPGHETVYSFHLNDFFAWQRNIRVAVETVGFRRGDRIVRSDHPIWGTTAYWYARTPQPAGSRVDLIEPRTPDTAPAGQNESPHRAPLQLSDWQRGVTITAPQPQSADPMRMFLWFYEWNVFDARARGEHTGGRFDRFTKDISHSTATLKSDDMMLTMKADPVAVDLTLVVRNRSDHDWPVTAAIIPCFNPSRGRDVNRQFINEKTWFAANELTPLEGRGIHFNKALDSELRKRSADRKFVFSDKWPTTTPDASAGILIRESEDSQWVCGIAWERFLSVQGHNPWHCMHVAVQVGPLARNAERTIKGRIYLMRGTAADCWTRYRRDFGLQ
jgi:hypothetical protein